ncbi:polyprenyl synthetase family protein [Candidatus Sumerlaeota bacterium]|nr:polyprenyl synthetase family protein [Candidatus Sumerlaeota bacterium]
MSDLTAVSLLERLRAHLERDLARVESHLAGILANERTELTDDVGDHLSRTRGKRIRPILTLLTARGLGADGADAAPVAAAMECVHVASLLHDDVIDQALLRRGAETVHKRYGSDVAILMGNYLYSHAFQLLLGTVDPRPLRILTAATARMCEGEMYQIQMGDKPLNQEQYMRIITDKTAHLISVCTELGAILADADEGTVRALRGYGRELGMAYQIVDDALDYCGSGEDWGKTAGIDLREGKWTLPLIRTFNAAPESDRRALMEVWNNGRELPPVLEIVQRHSGIEQCFEIARERAQRAVAHLTELPSNEDLNLLRVLPGFVVSRTH